MLFPLRLKSRGKILSIDDTNHHTKTEKLVRELNEQGFRVVALAYKIMPETAEAYTVADESDLILLGFLAFLDPPKETALKTLEDLRLNNIQVKILTGDNEIVTRSICKQVGLSVDHILLGQHSGKNVGYRVRQGH